MDRTCMTHVGFPIPDSHDCVAGASHSGGGAGPTGLEDSQLGKEGPASWVTLMDATDNLRSVSLGVSRLLLDVHASPCAYDEGRARRCSCCIGRCVTRSTRLTHSGSGVDAPSAFLLGWLRSPVVVEGLVSLLVLCHLPAEGAHALCRAWVVVLQEHQDGGGVHVGEVARIVFEQTVHKLLPQAPPERLRIAG